MHQSISSANTVNASSALFQAIKENNLYAVKTILECEEFATGEKIDAAFNEEGLSLMDVAVSKGFLPIIQALWQKGARVDNPSSKEGVLPVHQAVANNHLEVVRWLINEAKVDSNVKDMKGLTPLHKAAEHGHLEVVKFLVNEKRGADLEAESDGYDEGDDELEAETDGDFDGDTPLHYAAKYGHLEVVRWLINEANVDSNVKDMKGLTPLHKAAEHGHLEVVKFLVNERGADLEAESDGDDEGDNELEAESDGDFDGDTPLHYAAKYGHLEVVRWLINEAKVDSNVKDMKGLTPLHKAAEDGHLEVIKLLVDKGADLKAKTDEDIPGGDTPLHYAAKYGYLEVVMWLINEAKVDSNIEGYHANTPLHYAAENGHLEVVKCFVDDYKVDINIKNDFGETPLFNAVENSHFDVVKWLIDERQADWTVINTDGNTLLHSAAIAGNLDVIKWLHSKCKLDPNAKNIDEDSPVFYAVENGHLEVVKWLIEQSNININAVNTFGYTILHCAANTGHLDVVKWLINEAKMDPNALTKDGETPLFLAVTKGKNQVVNALLEIGVKIDNTLSCMRSNRDEIYNYYGRYLSEIKLLMNFFSYASVPENHKNNDRKNLFVSKILQRLEKHKNLVVRNEQKKTLMELVLENFIDKSAEEIGITSQDKDKILNFFATQVISEFRIDNTKEDEAQQNDLNKFQDLVERFTNAMQSVKLCSDFLWEVAAKYQSLMKEGQRDYTRFIVEIYQNILELNKEFTVLEKTHLKIAYSFLGSREHDCFVNDKERIQQALFHAFSAGNSEDAVRLRKQLVYGAGIHDDKKDPFNPSLLSRAYYLATAELLASQKEDFKAKDSLNKPNNDVDDVIIEPRAEQAEEHSNNKRERVNEEVLANQSEAPIEAIALNAPVLLHSYRRQGTESDLKKARVDFSIELNDKGESSTKKSRVDEELKELPNPNNNNNTVFNGL